MNNAMVAAALVVLTSSAGGALAQIEFPLAIENAVYMQPSAGGAPMLLATEGRSAAAPTDLLTMMRQISPVDMQFVPDEP